LEIITEKSVDEPLAPPWMSQFVRMSVKIMDSTIMIERVAIYSS
jgi:hypothetical protein